jgi:hypothetical protein
MASLARTIMLTDNIYLIYENTQEMVEPGTEHNFNYLATIPQNILNYTAIGKIAARYYMLYIDAAIGCCTQAASTSIHLLVHSRTPIVVERKDMQIPQNWAPRIYPKLMWQNMPPFQNFS